MSKIRRGLRIGASPRTLPPSFSLSPYTYDTNNPDAKSCAERRGSRRQCWCCCHPLSGVIPSRYHIVAIHLRPSRSGQPECSVVHRGRIAVDLVAEEEHHPPLWHNLQPRAVEGGVPALVADQTVGQARRDAPAAPVAAAMALAVAVRPVLVAVVLVVDGVDRLLRTPRRPGVGRTVRGVASAWSRVVCVCMCRACPSFSTSSSYSATSRAKANLRRISRVTTSVSSSKSGTCADGAAWSVTSPEMGPPPLPPARRHVDAVRGAVRGGCALRAGEDHRGSHPRQRQVDHVPLADAAGHWTVADKSRTAPRPTGMRQAGATHSHSSSDAKSCTR